MRNIIKLIIAIAFVLGAYLIGFNLGTSKSSKELKSYKKNTSDLEARIKLTKDSLFRITNALENTQTFYSAKVDSLNLEIKNIQVMRKKVKKANNSKP